MGFSTSCDNCGRTVLGIATSLRNINGRNLCPRCAKNPDSIPEEANKGILSRELGTKNYSVFEHPGNRFEAVKQGWSWPAFFFTWVWALVKNLWVVGIVVGIVGIAVGLLLRSALQSSSQAGGTLFVVLLGVGFVVNVWFGRNGNKWREANLVSRNYLLIGQVKAGTPQGAVAKCRSGREPVREPELEILEEKSEPKVRLQCTACGLDKEIPRSKFGDRNGTVRVKCPKCKEPITVNLGK